MAAAPDTTERLIADIGGGAEERARAYAKLAELSSCVTTYGDGSGGGDTSAAGCVRTVHVGGLPSELEDASKLEKLFSRFGTVVGATVRIRHEGKKASWALVSFATMEQAQSALDGTADLSAQWQGLVSRELDEIQAVHSTGAMGGTMIKHTSARLQRRPKNKTMADIAVQCLPALCLVMCKEASEVRLEEYQQLAVLIRSLSKLDPLRMSGQIIRPGVTNFFDVLKAPASVLALALQKAPQDLTEADAITFICFEALWTLVANKDLERCAVAESGMTVMEMMNQYYMPAHCLLVGGGLSTDTDDRNMAIGELVVGMLRNSKVLPGLTNGAFFTLCQCAMGRPAVAKRLHDLEAIDLALEYLKRSGPLQWISCTEVIEGAHCGWALCAMKEIVEGVLGTEDITPHLLSSGYIDMLVSALKAAEKLPADEISDMLLIMGVLQAMVEINHGQCLPQIESKLRDADTSLRFCVNGEGANLAVFHAFGWTGGV
eukprot:SAG25_NODE_1288_length_3404_cov_3.277761_4_plen_489_part_00